MNNLYVYACSHGKFGSTHNKSHTEHLWTDKNSFSKIMSTELDANLVNRSQPGCSNFHIFQNILNDIDKIRSTDTVVIRWTYISRTWKDGSYTVMQHMIDEGDITANIYYKELYNPLQSLSSIVCYTHYLKFKLNCKFYYTISDNKNYIKSINKMLYKDFINDTGWMDVVDIPKNELFECGHANELGHKTTANFYIKHIRKEHETNN
jgi:hypothetical protein